VFGDDKVSLVGILVDDFVLGPHAAAAGAGLELCNATGRVWR
jgi:hypothetical protein